MPQALRPDFSDLTLEEQLPVLEQLAQDEYDRFPMAHEKLFQVSSMDRGIYQVSQVAGIAPVAEVGEAQEYGTDAPTQGFSTTFTARKYGVIIPFSDELKDDGKIDILAKNPERLATSMNDKIQRDAASVLSNAFTTLQSDGKALCAVDHPSVAPGAPTGSNRLATDADLTISSLELMTTLFRNQTDMSGKKIMIRPDLIVTAADNEFNAHAIIKSELRPGGDLNDVNAVKGLYGYSVLTMDYLTDPDAWFVANSSQNSLTWLWRKRPSTSSNSEWNSDTSMIKISARYAFGSHDWRGFAGTSGTP